MQECIAALAALIPDNVTQLVTPASVRSAITNIINAIYPASGYMTQIPNRSYAANILPRLMIYDASTLSPQVDYTLNIANGQALRLEKGTTAFEYNADVIAPNNTTITFTLFKNNVATLWAQSVTGTGNGNPQSVSFSGFDYSSTPNTVYEIRVSAESNNTAITVNNSVFLCLSEIVGVYT